MCGHACRLAGWGVFGVISLFQVSPRSLAVGSIAFSVAPQVFIADHVAPQHSGPVDEQKDAIASMDSELVFLLESSKVPTDIIAKFGALGYGDMDTFAHMEIDAKEVREMIKSDVTLDPTQGPQHRAMVARLLAVWESAVKRAAKLKDEEATQRAGDLPRVNPI